MNRNYIPDSHISARFPRDMTRHPYKASKCPVEQEYKFDGQGGYAPDSASIPPVEAAMYVLGTAFAVWFAWEVLKFLVGA